MVEAIEYRFVEIALDPVEVYRESRREGLMHKLKGMSADKLRILIRQYEIPCGDLGRRKKPDLMKLICEYAQNTSARIEGTTEEAA